jgi:hypothetical protein
MQIYQTMCIFPIGHVMSKHSTFRRQLMPISKIMKILDIVPYDAGFHFFTAIGHYTGETATSLDAFALKLQVIGADSVEFHFHRNDFQNWIKDTIGDDELAKRISQINGQLPAENLRKELLGTVQTRIAELRRPLPHNLQHHH